MKITLTHSEAIQMLKGQLKSSYGSMIEVEIENADSARDTEKGNLIADKLDAMLPPNTSANKITRIRDLRTAVLEIPELRQVNQLGLAYSKYAIEHWFEFLDYIRSHGCLPSGGEKWMT